MPLNNYVEPGYVDTGYIDGDDNLKYSLNGSHGSFLDNCVVTFSNDDKKEYTILSSFFFRQDSYTYGIMYVLKDSEGKISYVPAQFLVMKKDD